MKKRKQDVLVLDHFDSFTYNLVQCVEEQGGAARVVRTDTPFSTISDVKPDRLILSPGPGHPKDVQLFQQALGAWAGKIPILGVCLGHQAIAVFAGAKVTRNFRIMHGKISRIELFTIRGIFARMPARGGLWVCRYHSLVVEREEAKAHGLNVIAATEEDEVMAIEYPKYPNLFGVQFHPESIFTQEGGKIIETFLKL